MFKSQRLLLIGPVVVFLAVLAAESAAGGLDYWPSSEGLWYLNLELFGFLQRSHYFIADFFPFAYGQLLIVAIPILAVAALGQITKHRLPMAIASNLSFVFAGFAVYCNWFVGTADIRAASLDLSVVATQPASYVILLVTLGTGVSFAISHVMYLRSVR